MVERFTLRKSKIVFLLLSMSMVSTVNMEAQATQYPASANIVDVTLPPYNADNTGVADVTSILNQAFLENNDSHSIIYLPAGIYRVTNTVRWGSPPGCESGSTYTCHRYTILAGEGEGLTTIQLDDNAPLFQDASNPKLLLWTETSAAMSFENAVRNLTINTGAGNPGTHALGFEANNQGGIQNVTIKSEDGQGAIGLHMGTGDQAGPCHIRNLTVDGFKRGIYTFANQNSIYFEYITLRNQTEYGFYNRQQMVSIRALDSENEVPAIYNHSDGGSMVTLINSTLTGLGSADSEIAFRNNNLREIFLRNVTVTGYEYALQQLQNGFSLSLLDNGLIQEYTTNGVTRICDNVEKSLNLPIKETPKVDYEDTTAWVSITDYGAQIDNGFQGQGSTQDDTDAIQNALNSGASTILIPAPGGPFPSRFIAYDTIKIPATVTHLIGAKGLISGLPIFEILPGADTLFIEDFAQIGQIHHFSDRVIVLKNLSIKNYNSNPDGTSGDVFIEDVVGGPYVFHEQDVWARQMNVEKDSVNILNDGGTLWVFGMKTEKKGTAIKTINGGKTEVLGGLFYGNLPDETIPKPIFEIVESSFSISTFKELEYIGDAWDIKVRETRNGITEEFTIGNSSIRSDLFVSYPAEGINLPPVVYAGADRIVLTDADSLTLDGRSNDDALPLGDCYTSNAWLQISGPSSLIIDDASDLSSKVYFTESGVYELALASDDSEYTSRDTVNIYVYDTKMTTSDHDNDGIPSGNGADANLRGWSNFLKNYGGTVSFGPRHYNQFPAKSIVRIDRSANLSIPAEHVRFEIETSTTNTGLIEDWNYNVFGLNDGHPGEEWIEGTGTGQESVNDEVNYDNAPGFSSASGGIYDSEVTGSGGVDHASAVFLGKIEVRERIREKVSFASEALQQFVNQDTSVSLTFLITRETFALNTITFASKEHPTFDPPTLYLDECRPAASVYLDESAIGLGNGESWSNAYSSIDQIFSSPCLSEIDSIFIAEGIYVPVTALSTYSLIIDHPLVIWGGYQSGGAMRNPILYPSIISGNINDPQSDSDNIEVLFSINGSGTLLDIDGVIIEK